jgi:hypothetical protein
MTGRASSVKSFRITTASGKQAVKKRRGLSTGNVV